MNLAIIFIAFQIMEDKHEKVNDSRYIPKSQRYRVTSMKIQLKSALHKKTTAIYNKVQALLIDTKRSYTKRRMRKAQQRKEEAAAISKRKGKSPGRYKSLARVAAVSILAYKTDITQSRNKHSRFDTDSYQIGIDNRCSACISHVRSDFVGELKKVNRTIKGFGGTSEYKVYQGTLKWSWCEDNEKVHEFLIPQSYYIKGGKSNLLSPQQHWAKYYHKSIT